MTATTPNMAEQIKQALILAAHAAAVIREAGEIPSGHLYAALMGRMSLAQYEGLVRLLKKQGLVRESNHLLTWTGPQD